jgi:TonB family protein
MSSRRLWFVSLSVVGHLGLGFGIYASNTWGLEKLGPGKGPAVSLGVLGAQAPAGESPSSKETVKNTPKKQKPPVIVQLTEVKDGSKEIPGPATGTGSGAGSGEGSGSGHTPTTGGCAIPPCEEPKDPIVEQPKIELPKPKVQPPKRIAPQDLVRIGGRDDIQPPEHVKRQMIADDKLKSTGTFELCVNEAGTVSSVKLLRSTNYPDYDNRLAGAVRGWRYRPHMVNGLAVSVCSTVTFIYSIK